MLNFIGAEIPEGNYGVFSIKEGFVVFKDDFSLEHSFFLRDIPRVLFWGVITSMPVVKVFYGDVWERYQATFMRMRNKNVSPQQILDAIKTTRIFK